MEARLTVDMMEALARPFQADAIQWKPGATNNDKTRGLALAYVDLRHYIDRLNEAACADWSDDYVVQDSGKVVLCRLPIVKVTRADVGEAPPNDEITATTALAQSFKRACVKFGLGAYLYRLPRRWVECDGQRRCFTDSALVRLRQAVSNGNGSGSGSDNGDPRVPSGPHSGKPFSWLLAHDRDYLELIADEAHDPELRRVAQNLLDSGRIERHYTRLPEKGQSTRLDR